MKKRILSLVLALSMMISLFPVSALAQTPGGGTAEMAEENGTTATPIITIGSDGKPTTEGGENWTYEDSMLTLNSGTYDFSGKRSLAMSRSVAVRRWLVVYSKIRSGMKRAAKFQAEPLRM